MLEAIHSGGQTGADQGGLAAGVTLGLRTGGIAPRGWRTEDGPDLRLQNLGLEEDSDAGYHVRTVRNVEETDGTFWFGNPNSPGGKLTLKTANWVGRPVFVIAWESGEATPYTRINEFRAWLKANEIVTLNVAGNRESKNPGISYAVRDFLVTALK